MIDEKRLKMQQQDAALEAEQTACAQQPAVAVNRYHIALGENHVRLAFMELLPPHGWCRSVVIMDRSVAISLANSLNLILSDGGTKQ